MESTPAASQLQDAAHLEASSSLMQRRPHILPAGDAHISPPLQVAYYCISAMRKSGAHMWFIAAAHPSVAQTVTADRAHIVIAACLPAGPAAY
jgi:hypothetical protein